MAALKITFGFLIATCVFVIAETFLFRTIKTPEELQNVRDKCTIENNLSNETYYQGVEAGFNDVDIVDKHFKCYLLCAFIGGDLMSSNGLFLRYPYGPRDKRKEMRELLKTCEKQAKEAAGKAAAKGKNACDLAYLYHKCIRNKMNKKVPNN